MSFLVMPDSETFHLVRAARELPRLLVLSVEIVLVTPLFDELAGDEDLTRHLFDSSPPIRIVEPKPSIAWMVWSFRSASFTADEHMRVQR